MTRNYIGLATSAHDSALAIVDSAGKVVFAEATERYLQNKRAWGYSAEQAIRTPSLIERYCERNADLVVANSWSEASAAQAEAKLKGFRNPDELLQMLGVADESLLKGLKSIGYLLRLGRRAQLDVGDAIASFSPGALRKVVTKKYDHHLTHAAAALYSSPYTEAACAIVDGYGEGAAVKFYACVDQKLEAIDPDGAAQAVPTSTVELAPAALQTGSLGVFYALVCDLCGFDSWKGEEWKVMGLAPYGKHDKRMYATMSQYLQVKGLRLENPPTFMNAGRELQAYARKPGDSPLTVANLACTAQAFFADIMTELLTNLYQRNVSDTLVLGGGCALNSSYNGQILSRTPFRRLHVAPAPADDGNAVGAALLAYREDHTPTHAPKLELPYLGSLMSEEIIANVKRFNRQFKISECGGDIARKTAALLAKGAIVGWVQGRAEFGPRALGNRSILADPRPAGMKDAINARVKFREEFRPLAPAILHEHGPEYFESYQESPYMERTLRFREEVRSRVPAVVHVDGTGRLQTVKREWNERYYELIKAFHEITGVPLILNTSFNVMGKPIIHSVEDAMAVFVTTGLDALIVDDMLIEK